MAFRCEGEAAEAAAELVGVRPADIEALATIVPRGRDGKKPSGYCYWKDLGGQVTLLHVGRPVDPALDRASETTPHLVHVDPQAEEAA
jgi:hypothetical protein